MVCDCPLGAALETVPLSDCPVSFGQIQKLIFQRIYKAAGEKNKFDSSADIKTKSAWTALLAAEDSTKVVVTPTIAEPTNEPGAMKTYGSGNSVPSGIPINRGREASQFTAKFLQQDFKTIAALKKLQCEGSLGVFLVDENGYIGCIEEGEEQFPIPIRQLFISDRKLGGFDDPDSNNLSFSFEPNYDDNLARIKPTDFNPLDLRPAE